MRILNKSYIFPAPTKAPSPILCTDPCKKSNGINISFKKNLSSSQFKLIIITKSAFPAEKE